MSVNVSLDEMNGNKDKRDKIGAYLFTIIVQYILYTIYIIILKMYIIFKSILNFLVEASKSHLRSNVSR